MKTKQRGSGMEIPVDSFSFFSFTSVISQTSVAFSRYRHSGELQIRKWSIHFVRVTNNLKVITNQTWLFVLYWLMRRNMEMPTCHSEHWRLSSLGKWINIHFRFRYCLTKHINGFIIYSISANYRVSNYLSMMCCTEKITSQLSSLLSHRSFLAAIHPIPKY